MATRPTATEVAQPNDWETVQSHDWETVSGDEPSTAPPSPPPAPSGIQRAWQLATEPQQPTPNAGYFGKVGTSIGNIEGRALENVGQFLAHPIDSATGAAHGMGELWGLAFGAPTPGGPLEQRLQQFRDEYADDPKKAVENATGDVLGMYLAGKITDLAVKGAQKGISSATRGTFETLTKTTPRDTVKFVRDTVADNAKETARAAEKTIANQEKAKAINARKAEEHAAKVKAVEADNETARADATAKTAKVLRAHAEKVKTVEAANAAKTAEYESAKTKAAEIEKAAKEIETRRGRLARQVKEQSARLVERVKTVKEATKAKIDDSYSQIREKTAGATVPRESLSASVAKAEGMLKGSNESVKIFRDILSKGPEDEPSFVKGHTRGVTAQYPKGHPLYSVLLDIEKQGRIAAGEAVPPANFSDLQGYYSELGEKLAPGNLPSDVYLAMRSLQSDIGGMMQQIATERGVGSLLSRTQALYRDYMETFRESAGPNHSGSPIADSLNAKDPSYAIKPLSVEETAQRVRNMLTRFDPPTNGSGGAGQLYDNFRSGMRQFDSIGKPLKTPETPAAPTLAAHPSAPESVQPKVQAPPPAPKPIEAKAIQPKLTKVGPEEVQANKAASIQKGAESLRAYGLHRAMYAAGAAIPSSIIAFMLGHNAVGALELGVVPSVIGVSHGVADILEKPGVTKWLSAPTAADLAALEKLPAAQRTAAAQNLRPLVEAAKAKGFPVSSGLAKFVGRSGAIGPKTRQLQETRDQYVPAQ